MVRAGYRPHLVQAGGQAGSDIPPLLADRSEIEGRPTAYVCERFACQAPTTNLGTLASLL